jgi:hypothetical protein
MRLGRAAGARPGAVSGEQHGHFRSRRDLSRPAGNPLGPRGRSQAISFRAGGPLAWQFFRHVKYVAFRRVVTHDPEGAGLTTPDATAPISVLIDPRRKFLAHE